MSSATNTRHRLGTYKETPEKSFKFVDKSIPQADNTATVSSLCLSNPTQPKKSLERACLELFGSHEPSSIMEAEKRTWHLTPASGQDPKFFKFLFPERDLTVYKHKISEPTRLSEWQQHNNGTLCIIVRPSTNRTRWIAFDIDVLMSEQELVKELERVQQLHGVTFTYCRSTGGKKWHVWLFTSYAQELSHMRHIAALIANELAIKIDKLCPSGRQQITAPFAVHRPLKTTTGITITHPVYLPFNDAAIDRLSKVDTNTPKTKQKPVEAISQPDTQQTFTGNGLWISSIPSEIRAEMRQAFFNGADSYIGAIEKHYATNAEYRQHFVLAVAADLKKLGYSEADATQIVLGTARRKGDNETKKRTNAIKRTFAKTIVLGFATTSTATNVRETFFFSDLNKQGLANEQRKLAAEKRLVTAISLRMSEQNNDLYTAMRPLADNTGMSVKTVRAALERLKDKGILAAMKLPKKQGTLIQLLKDYKAYLVGTEQPKEATNKDVERIAKTKERHQKETEKDQKRGRTNTDTVVGTHKPSKSVTDTKEILSRGISVTPTDKGLDKQATQVMVNRELLKTITVIQLDNDDDCWECLKDLRQKHNQDV